MVSYFKIVMIILIYIYMYVYRTKRVPEKEWNGKTTEKWAMICLTLAVKCEQICGQ